jgi:hypothetical protein
METWEAWASRIGLQDPWKAADEGRRELEEVMNAVNRAFQAEGRLPWQNP